MGDDLNLKAKCPQCGKESRLNRLSAAQRKFLPFCSERCKLVDLGQWAAEKYRVPAETEDEIKESRPEDKEEN